MSKYITAIFFLFYLSTSRAQNLVPNPGFESYTSCPTFASMIHLASPWFNPTAGTPEYFNACAAFSSWVSVPASGTGHYQFAHGGNGYAGIYTYRTTIPNMREYIEVPLTAPLQAGKNYYFEMYVNAGNDHPYAADGIGMHVRQGMYTNGIPTVLPLVPQVSNAPGNILSDTLAWVRVSGCFVAAGGEDHLLIGNFNNDANTMAQQFNTNTWYTGSAYLCIDDVLLQPFEVNLGNDTVLCNTQSVLLDATVAGATYSWQDGTAGSTYTVTYPGTYWVDVTLGNCTVRDSITITIAPPPHADLLGNDTTACLPEALLLDAYYPGATYLWNTGAASASIAVTESGAYTVEAATGCGSVRDTIVVSFAPCECYMYMPNSFTPGGDGINDAFGPVYDCKVKEASFAIYDRWGHLIYETSDLAAKWDGKINGNPAPGGVYAWRLGYLGYGTNGWQHSSSYGHVLLLK